MYLWQSGLFVAACSCTRLAPLWNLLDLRVFVFSTFKKVSFFLSQSNNVNITKIVRGYVCSIHPPNTRIEGERLEKGALIRMENYKMKNTHCNLRSCVHTTTTMATWSRPTSTSPHSQPKGDRDDAISEHPDAADLLLALHPCNRYKTHADWTRTTNSHMAGTCKNCASNRRSRKITFSMYLLFNISLFVRCCCECSVLGIPLLHFFPSMFSISFSFSFIFRVRVIVERETDYNHFFLLLLARDSILRLLFSNVAI